jgi:hypothetical protein
MAEAERGVRRGGGLLGGSCVSRSRLGGNGSVKLHCGKGFLEGLLFLAGGGGRGSKVS